MTRDNATSRARGIAGCLVVVSASTVAKTISKEIDTTNIEPKQPTRKAPADWFTGDVYIDAIHVRKPEPSRMACGCVHFTPGARTAWHSHAVGQTLLITAGTALLGTRDGKVIVARPGQVVYTPPGQEHWHGAAADSFMVHIAMYEGTDDGDGARRLEHVTDEQYRAAATATETHRKEPQPMRDLTLPLSEAAESYRAMDERRAIKTLLRP